MEHFENNIASFFYEKSVLGRINDFCAITLGCPSALKPFRGAEETLQSIFSDSGFYLYPTVKKTTLFYDKITDCFFKILHPLSIKNKILFLVHDKTQQIYNLSKFLLSKGIKVPEIMAYGSFKKRLPFFVMKKIKGKSLYDILIREKGAISEKTCLKVITNVFHLHDLGYWLGDAHLSHIFIDGTEVSGFIDIDSIKRNFLFWTRNIAKDLAGLNHPKLPLLETQKEMLLKQYVYLSHFKNEAKVLPLIKYYTRRRWQE